MKAPKNAKPEKPKFWGYRAFERHREMVKKQAKKEDCSESEIVRRAVEKYCA